MSTKFRRFLSLTLLGLTLGACDASEPADTGGDADPGPGGKADDAAGSCESESCDPVLDQCLLDGGDAHDCYRDHAGCLAAVDELPLVDCDDVSGDVAAVCASCEDVPSCEEESLGDASDYYNCLSEMAECHWDRLGLLPGNCGSDTELLDPCASPSCTAAYEDCRDDDRACLAEYASCLAVVESLPVATCDGFIGGALEACESCEDLPECEVVEDGSDVNACQGAIAECQANVLGVFPGACEPTEQPEGASCLSSNGNTFHEGSCTNSFQCDPTRPDANEDGWVPRDDGTVCSCEDRWDSQGGCP
ncbi:MAG: hypothetical protein AAGA54_26885 [Myxococcota bacterium]